MTREELMEIIEELGSRVVITSESNSISKVYRGEIVDFKTGMFKIVDENGKASFVSYSTIVSVEAFSAEEQVSEEEPVKAEVSYVYEDVSEACAEAFRGDKELQSRTGSIRNIVDAAIKNHALTEKKGKIRQELTFLQEDFYDVDAIGLFAGMIYCKIEDWQDAAVAFSEGGHMQNACYCAEKTGDKAFLEKIKNTSGKTEPKQKKEPKKEEVSRYAGIIFNYNPQQKWGFIKRDIPFNDTVFFYIEQVQDEGLRRFLIQLDALPSRKIRVSFTFGMGRNGKAATGVVPEKTEEFEKLLEESELKKNSESTVKYGFIEDYDLFEGFGIVLSQGKTYPFRADAVMDEVLKQHLSTDGVAETDVAFTLKKVGGKSVVKAMVLTTEERKRLEVQYPEAASPEKSDLWDGKETAEDCLLGQADIAGLRAVPPFIPLPEYVEELPKPQPPKQEAQPKVVSVSVGNPFEGRGIKYPDVKDPCQAGLDMAHERHDPIAATEYLIDALLREIRTETALKNLIQIYTAMDEETCKKGLQVLEFYRDYLDHEKYSNLKVTLLDKIRNYDELIALLKELIPNTYQNSRKMHLIYMVARALAKEKKFDEANAYLEEWKKVAAKDAQTSQKLIIADRAIANNLYLSGAKEDAKELAQQILRIKSDDDIALAILNDTVDSTEHEITVSTEDIFARENATLPPYVEQSVRGVELAMLARGSISAYCQNDSFTANPKMAGSHLIPEYIEVYLKKMPPYNKSQAWAFLAKICLLLVENSANRKEDLENYDLTREKVRTYAGRSMVSKGDYLALLSHGETDTLRFFYSQALNLIPSKQNDSVNSLNRMFCSLYIARDELSDLVKKMSGVPDDLFLCYAKEKKCFSLKALFINTFLLPNSLSASVNKLLKQIFENPQEDCAAINLFLPGAEAPKTLAEFRESWSRAKEAHDSFVKNLEAQIDSAIRNLALPQSLQDACEAIGNSLNQEWLLDLDTKYLREFRQEILLKMVQAYDTSEFDRREDLLRSIITKCTEMTEKITDSPMELSFRCLVEALEIVGNFAVKELNNWYDQHRPKLNLECSCGYVTNQKTQVIVSISNGANLQTADSVELMISEMPQGTEFVQETQKAISSVKGGVMQQQAYAVQLSEEVLQNGYLEFRLSVRYTLKGDSEHLLKKEEEKSFHIELRSGSEFEAIENRYKPYAKGGAVTGDMFIGRQTEIERIADMLKGQDGEMLVHRGIIMYGQKRTGKSSIMANLQEAVEKRYGKDTYLFVDIGSIGKVAGTNMHGVLSVMVRAIKRSLKEKYPDILAYLVEKEVEFPSKEIEKNPDTATLIFNRTMEDMLEALEEYAGTQRCIPLFLIDEFTYLYEWIKSGNESLKHFPHFWKGFLQNNRVCSIVIGQDNTPNFIGDVQFANDFACMMTWPVNYLDVAGAGELIEEPMRRPDGKSRLDEDSVQMIHRLTAGSAFLIMWLCDYLVDYMNENQVEKVTKLVLNQALKKLFAKRGEFNWRGEIFEAQLVDPSKLGEDSYATETDNLKLLGYIACHTNERNRILKKAVPVDLLGNAEHLEDVLVQLVRRGVLTEQTISLNDQPEIEYGIRIDLLRAWLQIENGKELEEF